jgi:hypothetical protein
MPPSEDHPARRVPAGRCGPQSGLGNCIGVGRCLAVLDSVVARTFVAGVALENVHASAGPQTAADVDLALGQLDEIVREVREVRDIAFQLGNADTRIQPAGPSDASESGTA